jgi:hypothetical protein
MLHKRDSKNKCANYRGISLLSVISRMYEKTNANRLQALQAQLPECKEMQSEQMGFNPNHRVEDAVHGIVEGIKYNRNHGNKKAVLLSADVKKAYPSMPRGKMLKAIADMGVTGHRAAVPGHCCHVRQQSQCRAHVGARRDLRRI